MLSLGAHRGRLEAAVCSKANWFCGSNSRLETSNVDSRRKCPTRYVVPRELADEQKRGAWRVAAVVGASGSGKSLALKAVTGSFRRPGQTHWDEQQSVAAVVACMAGDVLTEVAASDTMHRLLGLAPSASARPHKTLSAGER